MMRKTFTAVVWVVVTCLSSASCSSTPNTIAGLSTLQSTISGSNYVFFVNPADRKLVTQVKEEEAGEAVEAGDHFAVMLDFGFLRYLQAVDPYVIVYSEAWMGGKPRPNDSQKALRQIILIKEGMAPNARLPVTSMPLLGPVTMGDDSLNVYVTVKVLVLSKKDNQETIQLVEGIASSVAAAAPMYAPIAGAAAATMAAFISQNKDKVEFEHTLVFSPNDFPANALPNSPHSNQLALREGTIAIVKGESRFRMVPYPNWYYYLYPFNWFGLTPDRASRRIETDASPTYTLIGEIIRLPIAVIGGLFSDARSDASWVGKAFFGVVGGDPQATDLTRLGHDGYNLVRCVHKEKKEPVQPAHSGITLTELPTNEFCRLTPILSKPLLPLWLQVWTPSEEFTGSNLFTEKTHMVISIQKTKGSLGTFDELQNSFSPHAELINEVTASSSEARSISSKRIDQAFESIKSALRFERAKRAIREDAQKGIVKTPEFADTDGLEDQETLLKMSVDANVRHTVKMILNYAKQDKDSPALFSDTVQYVKHIRTSSWQTLQPGAQKYELWQDGWKRVLTDSRDALMSYPAFREKFVPYEWETLMLGECLGSREKPAVSIGNVDVYKGPVGTKLARLSVRISPSALAPVSIQYLTVEGTAKTTTNYAEIREADKKSVSFQKGQVSEPLDISIISGGIKGEGDKLFVVKLLLSEDDKSKVGLCKEQAEVRIREGLGVISIIKVAPLETKAAADDVSTVNLVFSVKEKNPDPIRFKYKTLPGNVESDDAFKGATSNEIVFNPWEERKIVTVSRADLRDKALSVFFVTDSDNTNNAKPETRIVSIKFNEPVKE